MDNKARHKHDREEKRPVMTQVNKSDTAPMATPTIAVMVGDPAGIGPEVAVKAIASGELTGLCRPLLIGNIASIEAAASAASIDLPFEVVDTFDEGAFDSGKTVVLDPGDLRDGGYRTGEPSAAAGRAVVSWIGLADRLARQGSLDGWIMGPIDATSIRLSGAAGSVDGLQPPATFMFRMSGRLRVVPVTEHIRIRDIAPAITREAVSNLIGLADATLRRWGIPHPRIGVAGLNPHAMFEEDKEQIAPAVRDGRAAGIDVEGPVSPDSIFRHGLDGRYDVIVSIYHDQGQIALKSAAFEGACTIYLGVPYVRVTVPHGTAMDIAGRNIAQHLSMLSAFRTSAALSAGRGFLDS
jgi:4-phospho-D-threonate 3-dehydrogenase / 4-phospho-D-erythronate 3-dehydrogenase